MSNEQVGKCCGAAVRSAWSRDHVFPFDAPKTASVYATCWHVCTKCNQPCNVKPKQEQQP